MKKISALFVTALMLISLVSALMAQPRPRRGSNAIGAGGAGLYIRGRSRRKPSRVIGGGAGAGSVYRSARNRRKPSGIIAGGAGVGALVGGKKGVVKRRHRPR